MSPLVPDVPVTDAAQLSGMAGIYIQGSKLHYFTWAWPPSVITARIDISVLEATAVLFAAAAWAAQWRHRNVVLRCDNSIACFALNTLKTDSMAMALVLDVWESIQFRFGFSAFLLHVPYSENRVADLGSREPISPTVGTDVLSRANALPHTNGHQRPLRTVTRTTLLQSCPDVPLDFFESLVRLDLTDKERRVGEQS
jgi:hypothetical protein